MRVASSHAQTFNNYTVCMPSISNPSFVYYCPMYSTSMVPEIPWQQLVVHKRLTTTRSVYHPYLLSSNVYHSSMFKTCQPIVDRPCQQKKKPLRETTKNHVQQLNHHPITNYTNMVLRSRSNRLELMELRSKA